MPRVQNTKHGEVRLAEIFTLEVRQSARHHWQTESIYDPYGGLAHDFDFLRKTADSGRVIAGLFAKNRQYRVIRYTRDDLVGKSNPVARHVAARKRKNPTARVGA